MDQMNALSIMCVKKQLNTKVLEVVIKNWSEMEF